MLQFGNENNFVYELRYSLIRILDEPFDGNFSTIQYCLCDRVENKFKKNLKWKKMNEIGMYVRLNQEYNYYI